MISFVEYFRFERENFSLVTLSDSTKIRMDIQTNVLSLMGGYGQTKTYPTTGEYYATHRLWQPAAVQEWKLLEIIGSVPTGTSVTLRLSDGTDTYWWDGGAWAVVTPLDIEWNTQLEINTNLDTFPLGAIQPIIRLETTDAELTPEITDIRILADLDLDIHEDVLYRSVIPALRDNVRPVADVVFSLSAAASTFDLNTLAWEETLKVADVAEAFNLTTDPNKRTNIVSSFNTSTKVVTFTGSQSSGSTIFVRIQLEPVVAYTTDRDYVDLPYLPGLVIDRLRVSDHMESGEMQIIKDADLDEGYEYDDPRQEDWQFDLKLLSRKGLDQAHLRTAVLKFFQDSGTIQIDGLDTAISFVPIGGFESDGTMNEMGTLQDTLTCELRAIPIILGEARRAYFVTGLDVTVEP